MTQTHINITACKSIFNQRYLGVEDLQTNNTGGTGMQCQDHSILNMKAIINTLITINY